MKNEIILITWDTKELICDIVKDENIQTMGAYMGSSTSLFKYFREFWFVMNLPFKTLFYNRTLKNLESTLIVFDSMIQMEFMQWLKKENPKARIIFWYWNNEKDYRLYPDKLKGIGCEMWSFNKIDCEKYGLIYNTQFYSRLFFKRLKDEIAQITIKYDLVFVGRNKGRNIQIEELLGRENSGKIDIYTYYVSDNIYNLHKKGTHKPLSYEEFLKIEMQGKAILDWASEGNSGLSLRVMESLYFNKKLVTNNKNILAYDFYRSENIFIIGYESMEDLPDFLNIPYKKIKKDIKENYQFTSWQKRFSVENKNGYFI